MNTCPLCHQEFLVSMGHLCNRGFAPSLSDSSQEGKMTTDPRSYPPGLDDGVRQLVEWGKWSCEATETGWVIKTEPYSWCCNKHGQTAYHFDKDGKITNTEWGIGKP